MGGQGKLGGRCGLLVYGAIAIVSFTQCLAEDLEVLEAEFEAKLTKAEAPLLQEYYGKLEELQGNGQRRDGLISELLLAKTRLESAITPLATPSDVDGVGSPAPRLARALPIGNSSPAGVNGNSDQRQGILLLPKDASLSGKLRLSANEHAISQWIGGSAEWQVAEIGSGIWHLIFEYGMVPCGQNTRELNVQLGDTKKKIAMTRLHPTGQWDSYRATHVAVFELDAPQKNISFTISCSKGKAPELINLRHVLLRPHSDFGNEEGMGDTAPADL